MLRKGGLLRERQRGNHGAVGRDHRTGNRNVRRRARSQALEEGELFAGEEAELHPAEEVIHDGFGEADLLVAGPAGGLEAGVGELFAEELERHAVLEAHGDGGGEAIHEAGDGGAFFGHADEDFAGAAVGVEADGDVALMPGDAEFVGDGGALGGEAVTHGAWWTVGVGRVCIRKAAGAVVGGGVEQGVELRLDGGETGLRFGGLEAASLVKAFSAVRSSASSMLPASFGAVAATTWVPLLSESFWAETLRGWVPLEPSR